MTILHMIDTHSCKNIWQNYGFFSKNYDSICHCIFFVNWFRDSFLRRFIYLSIEHIIWTSATMIGIKLISDKNFKSMKCGKISYFDHWQNQICFYDYTEGWPFFPDLKRRKKAIQMYSVMYTGPRHVINVNMHDTSNLSIVLGCIPFRTACLRFVDWNSWWRAVKVNFSRWRHMNMTFTEFVDFDE